MKNTIRNYKNSIFLNFEKRGDNFSLDVPHYNNWMAIIRFLRKRGFKVGENKTYKEHYECLSKYHKIGFKKDIACLFEIGAASIKIEFGNIKNLWDGMAQSFWSDPSDDRYKKLTYLEGLAVKLEIKKLMEFCEKYNHEFIPEDYSFTAEEYIINNLKTNSHIHGKVTCLEDIKKSITEDSYDYQHNSNDANNKKIICGELKYFYNYYNRRMFCGIVWHNINNMWWVIVNGVKYNVASFNLFDFDKNLPKRKPASQGDIQRLLNKFESKKEYLRCHAINKQLEKLAA